LATHVPHPNCCQYTKLKTSIIYLLYSDTCSSSKLLPVYEAENINHIPSVFWHMFLIWTAASIRSWKHQSYTLAHRITLPTSVLIKLNYKCAVQQRTLFKHFHMHSLFWSWSSEAIFNPGTHHLYIPSAEINNCLIHHDKHVTDIKQSLSLYSNHIFSCV
jgi:hypothetical protein